MPQPGLLLDIVEDIRHMNDQALKAAPRKTGIIVLGGGAPQQPAQSIAQYSLMPWVSLTRRCATGDGHHLPGLQ